MSIEADQFDKQWVEQHAKFVDAFQGFIYYFLELQHVGKKFWAAADTHFDDEKNPQWLIVSYYDPSKAIYGPVPEGRVEAAAAV